MRNMITNKRAMKKSRLKNSDTGRWAVVCFDDIGRVDGVIVEVDREFDRLRVYFPVLKKMLSVVSDQIVDTKKHLTVQ